MISGVCSLKIDANSLTLIKVRYYERFLIEFDSNSGVNG